MTHDVDEPRDDLLPGPVRAYLDARDEHRYADAAALFAPDATVVDDGGTHRGAAAVAAWVEATSTAFRWTTTRLGQRVEGAVTTVLVRVDGDFPGGTVTLRQRFELDGDRIARLTIAP